ncbi:MAG: MerC domain-containing protein [Fimbriimonadaceae bacterium]|nr:MerC domain-containing protein [Fimbriimonadaceae bacterium]
MAKTVKALNWDKLGSWASGLCAVHCLLTGIALGLLSVVGLGFMANPWVEYGFIGTAIVVGIAAIVHGRRHHGSIVPAIIFVAGIALIAISHFVFGHGHQAAIHKAHSSTLWATLTAVGGGTCLVLFHVVNQWMRHRSCGCVHSKDCEHGAHTA